jgi:hypothetical protein
MKPLEADHFKYDHARDDFLHQNVMFHKKMEVINMEFDDKIAALVAQLMFKQSFVESKKRDLLAKLSSCKDVGEIIQLKVELQNIESLLKLDDVMNFTPEERELYSDPNVIPGENELKKRLTRIARKAMQFLRKLRVPNEDIFSHIKFHKALRIRAEKVEDGNFLDVAARSMKANIKPVIVAGIAFYLDHNKKQAVPMSPLE